MENNTVIKNNMFLIIPSWSKLLGNPFLGEFHGQKVSKILKDPLLFFVGSESTLKTDLGSIHFMFGMGYYYVKFGILDKPDDVAFYVGKYLTGLIISDFVYDRMAVSKDITLQNEREIVVTEEIIKIPIDMLQNSYNTSSKSNFISGTLMRNVFIPYKNIIKEMMNNIQNVENSKNPMFQLSNRGHALLTATRDSYDKILISPKLSKDEEYIHTNPGITSLEVSADDFLKKYFPTPEIEKIDRNIRSLNRVYKSLPYDPLYLFSIIEKASFTLGSDLQQFSAKQPITSDSDSSKQPILISAKSRKDEIIEWPKDKNFKRRTKEELEALAGIGDYSVFSSEHDSAKQEVVEELEVEKVEAQPDGIEDFELRVLKSKIVESRNLPELKSSCNIEEIFYYLKLIISEDYEIIAIGKAFEIAQDLLQKKTLTNIQKRTKFSKTLGEFGKFANLYKRKEEGLALNPKEKTLLLEKAESWISELNK